MDFSLQPSNLQSFLSYKQAGHPHAQSLHPQTLCLSVMIYYTSILPVGHDPSFIQATIPS